MRTFFLGESVNYKEFKYNDLRRMNESANLSLIAFKESFAVSESIYQDILISAMISEADILLNEDTVTSSKQSLAQRAANIKGNWYESLKTWFKRWIEILGDFLNVGVVKVQNFMDSTLIWYTKNNKLLDQALSSNFKYESESMHYPNNTIPKISDIMNIMTMVSPGSEGPKLQALIDKEKSLFETKFKADSKDSREININYLNIKDNLTSGSKTVKKISKRIKDSKNVALKIMNDIDKEAREVEGNPSAKGLSKEELTAKKKSVMDMNAINKEELSMANKIMGDSSKIAFNLIKQLKDNNKENKEAIKNGKAG